MEEKDTVQITVIIAGRPYPLKIKASDEPALRKIIKEVNEKINRFQLTYTKKDKQDCLSMAILTYAVDLHKAKQVQNGTSNDTLSEKIQHLDDLLDQMLE